MDGGEETPHGRWREERAQREDAAEARRAAYAGRERRRVEELDREARAQERAHAAARVEWEEENAARADLARGEKAAAALTVAIVGRLALRELVSGELCRMEQERVALVGALAREKRVVRSAGPGAAPSEDLLVIASMLDEKTELLSTIRARIHEMKLKPLPCRGFVADLANCHVRCEEPASLLWPAVHDARTIVGGNPREQTLRSALDDHAQKAAEAEATERVARARGRL